jgi:hypothetical protein
MLVGIVLRLSAMVEISIGSAKPLSIAPSVL